MKKYESNNQDDVRSSETHKDSMELEELDITEWVDEFVKDTYLEEELPVTKEEDEFLTGINESLSRQITRELETKDTTIRTTDKNWEENAQDIRKEKKRKRLKYTLILTSLLISTLLIFFLTPIGRNLLVKTMASYAYGKMNYDNGSEVTPQTVIDDVDTKESADSITPQVSPTPVVWETKHSADGPREEEGVTNILILGEEAIGSGEARGRTDIMMIATMNQRDKTYKLTSLMRDMLVQIPGNKDNKLNTAYELGGIPLLYETIEKNFDIKLNGYVLVGFDNFEKVLNELGGVGITLTRKEANYLNTTNYISKPEYRNVHEGYQVLNGNQALGYCRVRYVATGDNQLNDFGRTSRQRIVLNAIFEQYRKKSLPELALIMNDILPMITTDIKQEDFESYLTTAVSMGMTDIQNLRLPADHTFEEGYVRKMAVLIPDIPANIEVLHKFIFGSTK